MLGGLEAFYVKDDDFFLLLYTFRRLFERPVAWMICLYYYTHLHIERFSQGL